MHFLLGVLEFPVREGRRISGSERPNFLFGSLGFHVWGPRISGKKCEILYVHVFAVFFMRGSTGTIWYILRIIPNPLPVILFGDLWGSDRWQHAAAIFWGEW